MTSDFKNAAPLVRITGRMLALPAVVNQVLEIPDESSYDLNIVSQDIGLRNFALDWFNRSASKKR